jgi:predicted house-cleaning noncanonical NTP pyrophosphatase (MazG superfamily)
MWTFDKSRRKSNAIATMDAALDSELRALIEDDELCALLLSDPELNELADLTRLAEHVRTTLAPARRNIELSARARVQRICSAVLIRSGALPPEAALMDEEAQDHAIERKLAEYRGANKRGLAKLFAARIRGRRAGPSVRER